MIELAIDELLAKNEQKTINEMVPDKRCTSTEETHHNSEQIFNNSEGSFNCECFQISNIQLSIIP